MKDCWDLLNIPPDSDKETVKKAYARLAKFYHPEEHPREFVMLQKAFKEALRKKIRFHCFYFLIVLDKMCA